MTSMRSSRTPRLARGFLGASVATFVALLSHISAGGVVPGWIGMVLPLILSVLVCTFLVGRRLSLVRLTIAVAASQALFHLLFVLGTFSPSPVVGAGHVHDSGHALAASMTATDVVGANMTGASMTAAAIAGTSMWAAHAIAAAITVAALYRGERAILRLQNLAFQVAAWVRRRATILDLPALLSVPRPLPAAAPWLIPALSVLFVSLSRRRGPPLGRLV